MNRPFPKLIESGIEPKRNFDEELLREGRKIAELIEAQLKTFLLDLSQLEHEALERLREYTPTERLLTLKEAADYIHFAARTLDSWTAPGRPSLIQFVILGGEKRFKKLWLDAAIDNGSIKPRGVVKL